MTKKARKSGEYIELKQEFYIEAARKLPQLPPSHPCSQIHGHSFKITFTYRGRLNSRVGWLEDYHVLATKAQPILNQIDHQFLNNIKGLENPTTELLCIWLYKKTKKQIPILFQVSIKETTTTECCYPVSR